MAPLPMPFDPAIPTRRQNWGLHHAASACGSELSGQRGLPDIALLAPAAFVLRVVAPSKQRVHSGPPGLKRWSQRLDRNQVHVRPSLQGWKRLGPICAGTLAGSRAMTWGSRGAWNRRVKKRRRWELI